MTLDHHGYLKVYVMGVGVYPRLFVNFAQTINMKWLLSALLLLPFMAFGQTPFKGTDYMFYYQASIGKTNGTLTTPSAWLEIGKDSTTKGMRMPRVVDTANISAAIYGLMAYQIKDNGIYFRDKFGWRRLTDAGSLNNYLQKSDSTTFYYPLNSNPKNYVITEVDPSANAKTIRWIPGAGIRVSNSSPQALSSNPSDSIAAKVDSAIWNANRLQSAPISVTAPTSGQVLQYNGSQYVPVTIGGGGGTVTSVGLTLPSIFTVTNSPVTTNGTLTGAFNNQFANLVLASPNGISGQPLFRGLANGDLPNSPVSAGIYGSDTTTVILTINSKGITTSSSQIPIAVFWDSVRRKPNGGEYIFNNPAAQQSGNFSISGTGIANLFSTSAGTSPGGTTHIQLRNGTSPRWALGLISAEGGANSGSDFYISRIADNGTTIIGTAFSLNRVSGDAFFSGSLTASAPAYSSGGILSIGRNSTTGRLETFTPISSGPTSVKGFNTNATSVDTSYAYTIPAAYLTNNGDMIKLVYAGTFAATGATAHTVGLALGGVIAASMSNGTTSGGSWEIECTLIRVSNTVIRATTNLAFDNFGVTTNLYLHTTTETTVPALTTNGLRTGLSVGSPNANVTATMGSIIYYPAAP